MGAASSRALTLAGGAVVGADVGTDIGAVVDADDGVSDVAVKAGGGKGSGRDGGEGRGVSSRDGKDGKDRGLELHFCFAFGMVWVVSSTNKERAGWSRHGDG